MENLKRGMTQAATISVAALIIVLGTSAYFTLRPDSERMMDEGESMIKDGEQMMKEGEAMMEEGESMMEEAKEMMGDGSGEQMTKEGEDMIEGGAMMNEYKGKVLAGEAALLLDFNKDDYEKALASDKLITLYFYASWCPVCRAEFPKMQSAFNSLETSDVIGFRVNYNDSETDSFEKELAREFGVAYQHTKVFVKDGKRVLKSPEGWSESRYLEEINKNIK